MRFRNFISIVLIFLLLLTTGCGGVDVSNEPSTEPITNAPEEQTKEPSTDPVEEVPPEKEKLDMNRTYSILFIGNSYTYYNDMPTAIFEKLAESAGYEVEVTAITKGAYKLYQFADPADEYGAKVEKALTGTKKYDFVILQEQSVRPASENAPDFYASVRNLSERIKATGATPVLYATWGYKTGNANLGKYGFTNESMTWKMAASYQAIGDELGIPVIHVGLAFYDVYTTKRGIEIYNADKSHPSYAGSYLAAATLFAGIFNADPTGVAYTGSISTANATVLCEAAKKAVFETPSIPNEYLTTSKGIG